MEFKKIMKKIKIIGFVFMLFMLKFSDLAIAKQAVQADNEWDYILKYGDVKRELRRYYVGESNIPWAD